MVKIKSEFLGQFNQILIYVDTMTETVVMRAPLANRCLLYCKIDTHSQFTISHFTNNNNKKNRVQAQCKMWYVFISMTIVPSERLISFYFFFFDVVVCFLFSCWHCFSHYYELHSTRKPNCNSVRLGSRADCAVQTHQLIKFRIFLK